MEINLRNVGSLEMLLDIKGKIQKKDTLLLVFVQRVTYTQIFKTKERQTEIPRRFSNYVHFVW